MFLIRSLAVLPFVGILVGSPFLNRVTPLIFGLPLLFAWLLLWIVLTSLIMLIIYRCDPANRTLALTTGGPPTTGGIPTAGRPPAAGPPPAPGSRP